MKKEIKNKIQKRLQNNYTWWIDGDTLLIENHKGLKTEVYESDLEYNFDKAINIALEEIKN